MTRDCATTKTIVHHGLLRNWFRQADKCVSASIEARHGGVARYESPVANRASRPERATYFSSIANTASAAACSAARRDAPSPSRIIAGSLKAQAMRNDLAWSSPLSASKV